MQVICGVCVGGGGLGGRKGRVGGKEGESLKNFRPHLLANDSRHVARFLGG